MKKRSDWLQSVIALGPTLKNCTKTRKLWKSTMRLIKQQVKTGRWGFRNNLRRFMRRTQRTLRKSWAWRKHAGSSQQTKKSRESVFRNSYNVGAKWTLASGCAKIVTRSTTTGTIINGAAAHILASIATMRWSGGAVARLERTPRVVSGVLTSQS